MLPTKRIFFPPSWLAGQRSTFWSFDQLRFENVAGAKVRHLPLQLSRMHFLPWVESSGFLVSLSEGSDTEMIAFIERTLLPWGWYRCRILTLVWLIVQFWVYNKHLIIKSDCTCGDFCISLQMEFSSFYKHYELKLNFCIFVLTSIFVIHWVEIMFVFMLLVHCHEGATPFMKFNPITMNDLIIYALFVI